MSDYGEEYYANFGNVLYDVNRPLRKAFSKSMFLLPPSSTLTSFAFGTYRQLEKFGKRFEKVYGYEINPVAVNDAVEHGFDGKVWLQDCTVTFTPRVQTTLAVCYYLCEHISDQDCSLLIYNMRLTAPINMIVLTTVDDPNYEKDSTHCNPKQHKEWSSLLGTIYKQAGWTRVWSDQGRFAFAERRIVERLDSLKRRLEICVETW